MKFTTDQQLFIDRAKSGENIFLTGKAGTGKSFIVKEAIQELKNMGKKVACIAPTGIAAINIGGSTIHSMFSLPIIGNHDFRNTKPLNGTKRLVLSKIDVIIIDEVSMLRADVLDSVNFTMVKNRLRKLENIQIIFVGDMKQLPVVLDKNTEAILYEAGYTSFDFLGAKIMENIQLTTIELTEIKRQFDTEFIDALNLVREGSKSPFFRSFIHKESKGIILAPTNAVVRNHNYNGLKAMDGKEFTFTAKYNGVCSQKDFSMEKVLTIKEGCPIMYLKNEDNESLLRNGTIGTFHHKNGEFFIKVKGIKYIIQNHTESKKEYVINQETGDLELRETGSCSQLPIKLAFALSIHKSQGLTFDEVTVDISTPCFMDGQLYVALSRVRTPEGLRITV